LGLLSLALACTVVVWRVWYAPTADPAELIEMGPPARAPAPPIAPLELPPWPPTRADASAPLSSLLAPVTLGGFSDAWAAPPSVLPLASAAGVALLFHGCSHAGDTWATGGGGYRALLRELLARKLLPVALTSWDSRRAAVGRRTHGCWDVGPDAADAASAAAVGDYGEGVGAGVEGDDAEPPPVAAWGEDVDATRAVVAELARHWAAARGGGSGGVAAAAAAPPLVAIGVSSGGAFVSQLALALPLRAAALYVMPLLPGVLGRLARGGGGAMLPAQVAPGGPAAFPPALAFVHMPRDGATRGRVERDAAALRYNVRLPLVAVREAAPTVLAPANFSAAFAQPAFFPPPAARALCDALVVGGVLAPGGELLQSARGETARRVVEALVGDARLGWRECGGSGGEGGCAGGHFVWAGGGGGGGGGGALGGEARRLLKRGLGEVLTEAEGGHEMITGHAAEVAELLAARVRSP
jgi:hypothetical protein